MVQHGVSVLGSCIFITITYRQGAERLEVAGCVERDWRAFWRLCHKRYPQTKMWGLLRVMELTKRGTPHFHLVAGAVSDDARCYGRSFGVVRFLARWDTCECWSHRLSRVWAQVQGGESYIVHVVPVRGGRGAGAYMAKYLAKQMGERRELLGMSRRYSVNRLWPRDKRRRLIAPGTDGWRRISFREGQVDTSDYVDQVEFPRSGPPDVKGAALRLLKVMRRREV